MGLALLAVIWMITFVSTYFFIWHPWWLPVGASAAAAGIDRQFADDLRSDGYCVRSGAMFPGLFVWKYRDRKSAAPADYSHGNTTMEIVWTVLTAILFVGLNLMGSRIWAAERFDLPEHPRYRWR